MVAEASDNPYIADRKKLLKGIVAEGVGFEPTVACATTVFKTVTIDHSDTPPEQFKYRKLFSYRQSFPIVTSATPMT